jgi:hypothetical protein
MGFPLHPAPHPPLPDPAHPHSPAAGGFSPLLLRRLSRDGSARRRRRVAKCLSVHGRHRRPAAATAALPRYRSRLGCAAVLKDIHCLGDRWDSHVRPTPADSPACWLDCAAAVALRWPAHAASEYIPHCCDSCRRRRCVDAAAAPAGIRDCLGRRRTHGGGGRGPARRDSHCRWSVCSGGRWLRWCRSCSGGRVCWRELTPWSSAWTAFSLGQSLHSYFS